MIVATALYRYRNPLQTPLRFAGKQLRYRHGLLLKFEHKRQISWGDCAPLPGFSNDTIEQNQQALLAWCCQQQAIDKLPPAAQFAISSGRFMARNQQSKQVTKTVPLLVGNVEQMLRQALVSANTTMKLKLARNALTDEISLVQQLQQARPDLRLRIDANQGWQRSQAMQFAKQIDVKRIDYVEEPCLHLSDSLAVHQQTGLPLALDESTQAPNYQYQLHSGVVALVLKPTIIGSIDRLQHLISAAHKDGVACVLSSSFESNLGLLALATLAQQLTPAETPGLDTLSPLTYDLCQPNPWLPKRPLLTESQLEPLWQ
ncbi:o-succinylbenzoate synthase [Ferrimonas lipolytica]|uniref:o-succinylbenzoate synthase n=1 Tax=Ferrimonas lipolytica TaxID=2724191 RepID=A0A6H1UGE9_9GAMM|nr:o-succinylbenzoate synthase [Ferrimonas lipolytica]QIZ78185.1 o-succinylbenzoate synthase [Ferrimonas lipolytica]